MQYLFINYVAQFLVKLLTNEGVWWHYHLLHLSPNSKTLTFWVITLFLPFAKWEQVVTWSATWTLVETDWPPVKSHCSPTYWWGHWHHAQRDSLPTSPRRQFRRVELSADKIDHPYENINYTVITKRIIITREDITDHSFDQLLSWHRLATFSIGSREKSHKCVGIYLQRPLNKPKSLI